MIPDEPDRIMAAGDWHGNLSWAERACHYGKREGVNVIIHAGDFGYWVPGPDTTAYLRNLNQVLTELDQTLLWVDGNHEYHPGILEWNEATNGEPWADKRYPRIIHLPRGFRWEWWGWIWLALGGAHSVDRRDRTEGRSWWEEEHITDGQAARAMVGGADIMITHDCPYGVDIPNIPSDPEMDFRATWPMSELIASRDHRKKLAEVCEVVRPHYLIHGHYHVAYKAQLNYGDGTGTNVIGLDCDGSTFERNCLIIKKAGK